MVPSSAATAPALLSSKCAEPRVIQQFTSTFLVSRHGELWRVYDSTAPDGADRTMPSPGSTLPYRIFLALARKTEMRVHAFASGEAREIDSESLQLQLDESRSV
jgi:hypothetical protein